MVESRNSRSIFILCVLVLLAGTILIRVWFPLSPYFDQIPQFDIRSFSPSLLAGLGYGVLIVLLFASLWLAHQQIPHLPTPPRFSFILFSTFAFGLLLLNTYPINATDIYRYVIRGRVNSIYGQNQYEVPPNTFKEDPFAPFAGEWGGETSPYGPIWEMVATAVTHQTQDNLLAGLYAFKIIGLVAHLGNSVLIWLLLSRQGTNIQASLTLLWAWNPALLLTFIVNAHNDALMLFFMLLGYWLIQRQQKAIGSLFFVAAALTKPIALLALPIIFVAVWRTIPAQRQKIIYGLTVGIGAIVLVWLAFLPFGSLLNLFFRLVRESSAGGGFSFPVLIVLLNQTLGGSFPAYGVLIFGEVLFGFFAIWLVWLVVNGRSPLRGITNIFAAYMLQAFNFRLWYATWLFPWALLGDEEDGRFSSTLQISFAFLITSQLSVLIYGHLRVYALAGNYLWAHLIGVPFTFGLPLLLPKLLPTLLTPTHPANSLLHNS